MKVKMNPVAIKMMFSRIEKDLGHLFDDTAQSVIQETSGRMKKSYDAFKLGKQPTWGYQVFPERPLIFRQSQRPLQDNCVDLYCDIQWAEDELPISQDIKIRVWGLHSDLMFREAIDSRNIQETLTDPERKLKGRVISRFHFDRVNREGSGQSSPEYHPTYHLQVGGKSFQEELCWHPETFDIPRIPHHPMDFLLVCQLIAINFFPEDYNTIKEKAEWREQVSTTQKAMLETYYRKCLNWIVAGDSLLDRLIDI